MCETIDPVSFLEELVTVPSPSGEEDAVGEFLVKQMTHMGFWAYRDEAGNTVGVTGAPGATHKIVLLGHMDTVPGDIPVRRSGNLLYGRGAVDAKGPLAAFVDAAASVGAQPGWQFVVIGAVEEEGDSKGAWHVVERYRPEFAIIGEPSGWERVTLGYRGSLWFEYRIRRPLSHTASGNESGCEAAVSFWNRLRAYADQHNTGMQKIFEQISPTLRHMQSENDGFEERALLQIGVRLPPGIATDQWLQILDELRGDGEVRAGGIPVPAYRTGKNTPLVRAFLAGIRAQKAQPGFVCKSGTSDMNIVGPRWNCPVVAYGPGDSTLDHTPNERLSLAEYHNAAQVLAYALRALSRRSSAC